MSDPAPPPEKPQGVTVLCVECGDIVEVKDAAALVLALHMVHECVVQGLMTPQA